MMSTSQSGIIMCNSFTTSRPEDTAPKALPFEAWPEIPEWVRYCVFPTIGAFYKPEAIDTNTMAPEEAIIRMFPQLEPFKSQLMQMVAEYYLTHFGEEFNEHNFQIAIGEVLTKLLVGDEQPADVWNSIGDALVIEGIKTSSPPDAYSTSHEFGHLYSFDLTRPAISDFKSTWSGIEELLQQAAAGEYNRFWARFNDLNKKLEYCLSNSLAFEELRANIFALNLSPQLGEEFINEVFGKGKPNSETFHSLRTVIGGDLDYAWALTLLAECVSPDNPQNALAELQQILKAEGAHTWSGEQWLSWFGSWSRIDAWEIVGGIVQERTKLLKPLAPSATLVGTANGNIEISYTETMRLPLFLESMRQQLFNPKLIRNLTCPFKSQRSSCCGFGNSLRNIWAAIPNAERSRLKPPSEVCLNYELNHGC
jgi:hypothetical protein